MLLRLQGISNNNNRWSSRRLSTTRSSFGTGTGWAGAVVASGIAPLSPSPILPHPYPLKLLEVRPPCPRPLHLTSRPLVSAGPQRGSYTAEAEQKETWRIPGQWHQRTNLWHLSPPSPAALFLPGRLSAASPTSLITVAGDQSSRTPASPPAPPPSRQEAARRDPASLADTFLESHASFPSPGYTDGGCPKARPSHCWSLFSQASETTRHVGKGLPLYR